MASPARDFRNKVQDDHPGSTIIERGRRYIKHLTPDGTYILDTSLGPVHYGSQFDQEIDTAWVDSIAPWDKQMIQAGYNAYALTEFSNGQVVKYVHPTSGEQITFQPQQLQFTNDIDQIQSIGDPQSISATIDDDRLQWAGAYGTDLDFTWETQTSRLAKKLTIGNLASLGTPAQYIIDGGNPVLRLQFIFQVSSNIDLYINDELWDKTKTKETDSVVEFRNKTTGQPLWWFGYAHVTDQGANGIIAGQRFTKRANSLFVEVRVPWSWLETASYPVIVDPTVEPQIGASGDDAMSYPGNLNYTSENCYFGNDGGYNNQGYRFTVAVPKDAAVSTSYLTLSLIHI